MLGRVGEVGGDVERWEEMGGGVLVGEVGF